SGYGERWPHQLSGGQLQRVAIARALVIEPHVLLLDEPLSNLDAKLRVEMRGDIRKLQKQLGITVLYVTHDQEEALAVSDRIAVMRAGKIEQIASPRLIYEAPETPFVASFVGTTNLLNGIVRNRDGEFAEIAFAGSVVRTNSPRGKPGDAVVMSLRPEAFRLLAPGEAVPSGWATLSGTLGDIEYLGPVTRFAVALADGALLQLMAVEPPSMSGAVSVAYDPRRVVVMGAPSLGCCWCAMPFRWRSARSRRCFSACSFCFPCSRCSAPAFSTPPARVSRFRITSISSRTGSSSTV